MNAFEVATLVLKLPHLDLLVLGERCDEGLAGRELYVHHFASVYALSEQALKGIPQSRVDHIHDAVIEQVDLQLLYGQSQVIEYIVDHRVSLIDLAVRLWLCILLLDGGCALEEVVDLFLLMLYGHRDVAIFGTHMQRHHSVEVGHVEFVVFFEVQTLILQ